MEVNWYLFPPPLPIILTNSIRSHFPHPLKHWTTGFKTPSITLPKNTHNRQTYFTIDKLSTSNFASGVGLTWLWPHAFLSMSSSTSEECPTSRRVWLWYRTLQAVWKTCSSTLQTWCGVSLRPTKTTPTGLMRSSRSSMSSTVVLWVNRSYYQW